jgi:hypothetical protein
MNSTRYMLYRSITAPYYRRNAALFLFLFLLLFGLFPGFNQAIQFHYTLLDSIGHSTSFFLLALLVWILYTARVVHFVNGCTSNEAYNFLRLLNALPRKARIIRIGEMTLQLLAPVWIYGITAFMIALIHHHTAGAAVIIGTLVCLIAASTGSILLLLQFGGSFYVRLRLFQLPTRLFTLLLRYIFNQQIVLLILLKAITFTCLYFFTTTDPSTYDNRIGWLIYITSLSGHCILIYRNHHFIETRLSFYRNLPVRSLATAISLLGVYAVVLIPELWALKGLILQQHLTGEYISMACTGPCMLLLLHGLLYTEDMKMENYLQLLFGVWIVAIFFSLSANRWLLPLVCTAMAVFLFLHGYRQYEKNAAKEGIET